MSVPRSSVGWRREERTNKIDNTIGNTQSTSSLNTSTNILHIGGDIKTTVLAHLLTSVAVALKPREKLPRQRREARHHIASNQILRARKAPLHRNLHLQLTPPESKIHDLLDARGLSAGQLGIVLGDLVAAGDTDVDATFTDEGGDVGSGEEDESDGKVLDEGDVEAGFAAELHVAAGEEVEGCLLEAALFS